jgi:hypothetical protein
MSTIRWIIVGILSGAAYSWLVTITFARTSAAAWPGWYQAFLEGQPKLGLILWDIAMGLPALVFALLIGFVLVRALCVAALPASVLGAIVSLTYVVSTSLGNGWMQPSTFIVVGLLPISALVLVLHNKRFKRNTGSVGAAEVKR